MDNTVSIVALFRGQCNHCKRRQRLTYDQWLTYIDGQYTNHPHINNIPFITSTSTKPFFDILYNTALYFYQLNISYLKLSHPISVRSCRREIIKFNLDHFKVKKCPWQFSPKYISQKVSFIYTSKQIELTQMRIWIADLL